MDYLRNSRGIKLKCLILVAAILINKPQEVSAKAYKHLSRFPLKMLKHDLTSQMSEELKICEWQHNIN